MKRQNVRHGQPKISKMLNSFKYAVRSLRDIPTLEDSVHVINELCQGNYFNMLIRAYTNEYNRRMEEQQLLKSLTLTQEQPKLSKDIRQHIHKIMKESQNGGRLLCKCRRF